MKDLSAIETREDRQEPGTENSLGARIRHEGLKGCGLGVELNPDFLAADLDDECVQHFLSAE